MSTGDVVMAFLAFLALLGSFLAWMQSQINAVRKETSERLHQLSNRLHEVEGRTELLWDERIPPNRRR